MEDHNGGRFTCLRTYWYDGATNAVPTPDHEQIGGLPYVKVRLGRLIRGEQKGVDALIYRDLMTLARERAITCAYLLSGDEDLREGDGAPRPQARIARCFLGRDPVCTRRAYRCLTAGHLPRSSLVKIAPMLFWARAFTAARGALADVHRVGQQTVAAAAEEHREAVDRGVGEVVEEGLDAAVLGGADPSHQVDADRAVHPRGPVDLIGMVQSEGSLR